jgi:hypothetical protein
VYNYSYSTHSGSASAGFMTSVGCKSCVVQWHAGVSANVMQPPLNWRRHSPPDSFAVYVVTNPPPPLSGGSSILHQNLREG